jgi:hypothetical protein
MRIATSRSASSSSRASRRSQRFATSLEIGSLRPSAIESEDTLSIWSSPGQVAPANA